jgi:hypothetical protein
MLQYALIKYIYRILTNDVHKIIIRLYIELFTRQLSLLNQFAIYQLKQDVYLGDYTIKSIDITYAKKIYSFRTKKTYDDCHICKQVMKCGSFMFNIYVNANCTYYYGINDGHISHLHKIFLGIFRVHEWCMIDDFKIRYLDIKMLQLINNKRIDNINGIIDDNHLVVYKK